MTLRTLLGAICWTGAAAYAAVPAEIVSIEGKGEYREAQQASWRAAKAPQPLNASDFVRTLDLSKMAILFADRTRLQLSPNSTLQIKGAGTGPDAKTILNLNNGRAWATSKSAPRGVTVETQAATAAIRGTEWEIAVDDAGRTTLSVFSGEVEFTNEQGGVVVGVNEQAVAEKGKAPVKLTLRISRDRVQWVSSYAIDVSRYNARADLPDIAALIDDQRLAEAYAALKARSAPGASAALLLADFEIYRGDLPAAERVLKDARSRYPSDERFDITLARIALFDDRAGDALALARASAANRPQSIEAWILLGDVERHEGHAREAIAAYRQATRLQEKDARGFLGLGIVEGERENVRQARELLERAIALDARSGDAWAELGTVEGAANDFARARDALRRSLELNPRNYVAWTGLGIVELRAGHLQDAADALARASTLEPRYARVHLYLAAVLYRIAGDAGALEELRRASELDPNDPLPHFLASMVYVDRIEPGRAVEEGQLALDRLPYLKSLNAIASNQRGIANAGYPLAALGLEAWARSAAQESYLPSWGGSHFFLADRYAGEFDRRSELIQGFITDPIAFGASNRFQTLFPEPGHHATVSMRAETSDDLRLYEPVVTLNGYRADRIPLAYYVEAGDTTTQPGNLAFDARLRRFTGALGVKPTNETGAFVYLNHFKGDIDIGDREGSGELDRISGKSSRVDGGFSYAPDSRSRLWIKGGAGEEDSTSSDVTRIVLPTQTLQRVQDFRERPRSSDVGVRYTIDWSERLELTAGAEFAKIDNTVTLRNDTTLHLSTNTVSRSVLDQDDRDRSESAYVHARWRAGDLRLEAGAAFQDYRKDRDSIVGVDTRPANDTRVFERHRHHKGFPAAGFAWRHGPGVVRGACRRFVRPIALDTLMPVSIAGVPIEDQFVFAGGEIDQCRAQVETTIGRKTFAMAFFERLDTHNLFSPLTGILNTPPDDTSVERLRNRVATDIPRPDQLEHAPIYAGAVIRRTGVAFEHLVTQRLAARIHYTYSRSSNNDYAEADFAGKEVPYLPRHWANAGLTWAPGWHMLLTVQAAYRSRRFIDEFNTPEAALPAGWDGQVVVFVETPDKRWSVEAKAINLGKRDTSDVFGIVVSYRF